MSGTELVYAAARLDARYRPNMCCYLPAYAMSGTDLAYAATSVEVQSRVPLSDFPATLVLHSPYRPTHALRDAQY
eukprot:3656673-Rhodomonas_salina.1